MARRRGRLGRALRNDRTVRGAVQDALSLAPSPLVFRRHHNTMYRIGELVSGMAQAAATNGTLAAAARRLASARDGDHPTQGRCRECLASAVPGQAGEILAASAAPRLSLLAQAKGLSGICLIAVDMHDIARRGKGPGSCLVRSREKNGARLFERAMTAQCVDNGRRTALAMEPVGAPGSVPRTLRRPMGTVKRACAGAGLMPVLPVDRGLTGAGVLRALREERVRHCTPVRRTDNVVNATREHAAGTRGRVPAVAMESRRSREHHAAVIVPRRDSGARPGAPAREGLVVFAAGAPWVDVERCAKRWGTGTRCREPGRARIRTASTNPAGRALCLAHSPVMLNAWAVAMAMAMAGMAPRRAAKWARITHSESCDVAGEMAELGTLLPEPPPGPP